MLLTINKKTQQGFSRSAKSYDLHSGLHRQIADKLLAQVLKGPIPSAILDVGCGTGYLTGKMKGSFPNARVIGLDFAQGMITEARLKHEDIVWVLADGNDLPFSNDSFDIVISNLVYQWAGDLLKAFGQARRVLAIDGVFACTLFGYNTCQELFQSLTEAQNSPLAFTRLLDEVQIREALINSGFKEQNIIKEQIKIEFKDMHDLIVWLKFIGANSLPREGYIGKETMARAAAIYQKYFSRNKGIQATFEVIQVYVKK